jgi:glycosyltransferase involved in cell wall biosynthesis
MRPGSPRTDGRIGVCYLAPWVDYGGSDKGTLDWCRWLDRDRFAATIVTTQPSSNRRLNELAAYAEEVWPLPEFLAGRHFPFCIFDLIATREIEILHIMNSRIGFDLLPDLAALPRPPQTVVQLHVEEPDRSGYVRYVTTRYGNLVDAFSVSSNDLALALERYDVNRGKIWTIPTGVDAVDEFNPVSVERLSNVAGNAPTILYPGRLTDQKNPLLMVEVIARIVASGQEVEVHVVGDGPLEMAVRRQVRDSGLDRYFAFHPPSTELARWMRSCDLLLMTSVFEGVPYVIYEAMAMELAVVAPDLPGNRELMADAGGLLVHAEADADTYAKAVTSLIQDQTTAKALARAGRRRVLDEFDVRRMGERHGHLYEELLDRTDVSLHGAALPGPDLPGAPTRAPESGEDRHEPPKRQFARPAHGQPLVSIVIPCFNHGVFLAACLSSVLGQEYPELEVLVVDDASTDEATIEELRRAHDRDRVQVITLDENSGPSAARNRAVAIAKGRYILPVDADNMLVPGAIAALVEQLQGADAAVGYIYPNCRYFGTRDDYFQPPPFNLALLLQGNYCDTCSLIDRDVFDAGVSYSEDLKLGHEDWDFVLKLASEGIRGEPAYAETLLYRKHGFTRSDAVEYASRSFQDEITGRHPGLYGDAATKGRFGRWRGPAATIKARDAPGLSLVMTVPLDMSTEAGTSVMRALERQSSQDVELIAECRGDAVRHRLVRAIDGAPRPHPLEVLREALRLVRAPHVLLAGGDLPEILSDPALLEKIHRTFLASPALDAVAFTDTGGAGTFNYRLLGPDVVTGDAHSLAWRATVSRKLCGPILVQERLICESIARAMSVDGVELQWRHARSNGGGPPSPRDGEAWIDLAERKEAAEPHRKKERRMLAAVPPAIPALPQDGVRRWLGAESWMPPETEVLTRHKQIIGTHRIVKLGRDSPIGYALEFDLGAIQRFAPPGTARLVRGDDGLRVRERGSPRLSGDEELGHLELAPLPMLTTIERVDLPDGSSTLIAGARDPLRTIEGEREFLGFIESFPNEPSEPPDARRPFHGLVGLVRSVDLVGRRHAYHVDSLGSHRVVGELGALHVTPRAGSIAVAIDDAGRVSTPAYIPPDPLPTPLELARWTVAPLRWRRFSRHTGRVRAVLRRATQSAETVRRPGRRGQGRRRPSRRLESGRTGLCVGYLHPEPGPGRRELFAAAHPVTGDQLLTHHALEAADMGYGPVVSVGYVIEQAPLTGSLEMARIAIPWASRFGLAVRR